MGWNCEIEIRRHRLKYLVNILFLLSNIWWLAGWLSRGTCKLSSRRLISCLRQCHGSCQENIVQQLHSKNNPNRNKGSIPSLPPEIGWLRECRNELEVYIRNWTSLLVCCFRNSLISLALTEQEVSGWGKFNRRIYLRIASRENHFHLLSFFVDLWGHIKILHVVASGWF